MPSNLIVADDQYQLGTLLMGSSSLLIGQPGVSGWDALTVRGRSTALDMADGEIVGVDTLGPLVISIPLVIVCDSEGEARSGLAMVLSAWRPPSHPASQDVELHRRVAGAHEWVVGRSRGCVVEMRHVKSGVIPVQATFRVPVPVVHVGDES